MLSEISHNKIHYFENIGDIWYIILNRVIDLAMELSPARQYDPVLLNDGFQILFIIYNPAPNY
jgi:hypothetical protein